MIAFQLEISWYLLPVKYEALGSVIPVFVLLKKFTACKRRGNECQCRHLITNSRAPLALVQEPEAPEHQVDQQQYAACGSERAAMGGVQHSPTAVTIQSTHPSTITRREQTLQRLGKSGV